MGELEQLKNQINKSLKEVIRLLLENKRRIMAIEKRIEQHNVRSGHKI